ncbi:MAG TPA: methyltransferase domain-containing protein [Thermoplasmata archaeon]|nr:methyltransferase domain-containing protein [Thermoplasmata archaeon]HUJ78134.1 methyltransferase domain-containing protein [Thermoplasmata archaeon]
MTDDPRWRDEARAMVAALGPVPPAIAAAMRSVPRHRFVPATERDAAYRDEPLPLEAGGATISAPHMVALQLEYAELGPGLAVLEIGSGSGYLAALMATLVVPGGRVRGVELEPSLARLATARIRALHLDATVEFRAGDGRLGWPEAAPFDRVVVSCATREVLSAWTDGLAPGGFVVAPVGDAWEQRLVRYRTGPSGPVLEEGPACRFVALRRAHPSDI